MLVHFFLNNCDDASIKSPIFWQRRRQYRNDGVQLTDLENNIFIDSFGNIIVQFVISTTRTYYCDISSDSCFVALSKYEICWIFNHIIMHIGVCLQLLVIVNPKFLVLADASLDDDLWSNWHNFAYNKISLRFFSCSSRRNTCNISKIFVYFHLYIRDICCHIILHVVHIHCTCSPAYGVYFS